MKHAPTSLIALSLLSPAVVLAAPDQDISAAEYTRQLKAAKVWHATDVESFDMIEGVAGPKEVLSTRGRSGGLIKPTVHCTFEEPEGTALGGKSAKFECKAIGKIGGKESRKLKVKYDPAEILPPTDSLLPWQGYNGEVYSEVAASRLLTALGFKTDRMFPVTLVCHNCPQEPYSYITRPELRATMGRVDELVLERAAIEIKAEGEELGTLRLGADGEVMRDGFGEAIYDHVGWGLDQIRSGPAAAEDPAERTSREALVALLGLLQHADNKAPNQRLLCTDWDKQTNSCSESYLVAQDLGSLFAKGVDVTGDSIRGRLPLMTKFDWSQWDSVRVWKWRGSNCQLKVNTIPSLGGRLPLVENTFRNKVISVAARDFLLRLLARLTDGQLADVFMVAQTDLRDEQVRSGSSAALRTVGVEDWVRTFKEKRRQLASTEHCR